MKFFVLFIFLFGAENAISCGFDESVQGVGVADVLTRGYAAHQGRFVDRLQMALTSGMRQPVQAVDQSSLHYIQSHKIMGPLFRGILQQAGSMATRQDQEQFGQSVVSVFVCCGTLLGQSEQSNQQQAVRIQNLESSDRKLRIEYADVRNRNYALRGENRALERANRGLRRSNAMLDSENNLLSDKIDDNARRAQVQRVRENMLAGQIEELTVANAVVRSMLHEASVDRGYMKIERDDAQKYGRWSDRDLVCAAAVGVGIGGVGMYLWCTRDRLKSKVPC